MMPVSEETPWKCRFYFIRRGQGEWLKHPVAETNHTWAGSYLKRGEDSALLAYLVVGSVDGETLSYGGGDIEEWISLDGGASWKMSQRIEPARGLLYNNPRPVEDVDGSEMDNLLLFYGWKGPGSIQPVDSASGASRLRGKAYLWNDGTCDYE